MSIDFTLAGAVIFTGVVVVFIALVGLSLIVWLFGQMFHSGGNKAPKSSVQQPSAPKPAPVAPVAPAKPAMVVEDGISDEVVAVIAAAVAAMGAESGGFALRSIRRTKEARPVWAQAGLMQNTQPF